MKDIIKVPKSVDAPIVLIAGAGAANWGLDIFFKFNIVEYLAEITKQAWLVKTLYGIIGVAGLLSILVFLDIVGEK